MTKMYVVLLLVAVGLAIWFWNKSRKPALTPAQAELMLDGATLRIAADVSQGVELASNMVKKALPYEKYFGSEYFEAKAKLHQSLTTWTDLGSRCREPEVTGSMLQAARNEAFEAMRRFNAVAVSEAQRLQVAAAEKEQRE